MPQVHCMKSQVTASKSATATAYLLPPYQNLQRSPHICSHHIKICNRHRISAVTTSKSAATGIKFYNCHGIKTATVIA